MFGGNVDWVALVEAAYAPAPTHHAWAEGVVDAAQRTFRQRDSVGFHAFRHSADCSSLEPIALAGWMRELGSGAEQPLRSRELGPSLIRDFYYPSRAVSTALSLLESTTTRNRETLRTMLHGLGVADTLGIVVHPMPGVPAVLYAASRNIVDVPPHAQRTLSQVALHIEAGLRLRLRPESVRAVLTPSGRIEHWNNGAPERDVLKEHVKLVESARRGKNRRDARNLDPWTALVRGQVSLVERSDGGRRYYLVVENAPAQQPIRALTKGEVDAVAHASRGHSSKMVAYALGVAESTVSHRLGSAAKKVGLASRTDIVRVAAMLARDPRAGLEETSLTTAERDVLELVAMGLTNAEIAQMRNRSARTIANQVASLLAKTGATSRRALAARHV